VHKLHYQVDGWLGDVLLSTFPCCIITSAAARELRSANIRGLEFNDVKITTSEEFDELFPEIHLPQFVWLKAKGIPGSDDFATAANGRLIVSEKALELLKQLGIDHARIEEVK